MVRAGFPDDLVVDVVEDCARKGYQSDRRYAEVLAGHRSRQGYGPLRVQAELRQKGVADGDVEPLTAEEKGYALERAYTRRYGWTFPESLAERATRERFLQRRGFSGAVIRDFFRRLKDNPSGESEEQR